MSIMITMVRNLGILRHFRQYACGGVTKLLQKQNNKRCLYVNSHLGAKMYMEHENKYAYNILENKGYVNSLVSKTKSSSLSSAQFQELLQNDWSKKTPSDLFEVFAKLAVYSAENNLCISDNIFDNYIDNLTDNIRFASDKELESLFYSLDLWPQTPSIRSRNFIEVWAALDDECLNRVKNWSYNELLNFVALFYMVNVTRVSDFSVKSLNKLTSKVKQLTPGQVVSTMFFVGVMRKQPFDMHNLELYLDSNFTSFTHDDLAIMSMGFFKSKTPIRNFNLVSKIINVVMANSKTIHEVSLAALLKVIRYSMKITVNDSIYQMLHKLQHEVPRLSTMCNVHIALVGSTTLTLHKDCLTIIAEYTMQKMSNTRLKDLERLVLTYGTFNLRPNTKECFFTKVIDELRKPEREPEILKYGRSFACCVSYFGLLGIYPVDLMNKVLSKDFLTAIYGKQVQSYGREVLIINNVAEIFCSNFEINRLDKRAIDILAKRYTDYVPSEEFVKQYNVTERMMLDVMKVLRNSRGGNDYVVASHIVPHHQRGDIIICNDISGKPLSVKDAYFDKNFGSLKKPPDNNKWIVLVIAGRNAIIHGTDTPTGHFMAKISELQKMGYYAATVPWSIYSKYETEEEKEDFLNSLINNAVKIKPG